MWRRPRPLAELAALPAPIAWKLTDSLFGEMPTIVIGAAVYVLLGVIGFLGTGSPWYVAAGAMSAGNGLWRMAQCHLYWRNRDASSPTDWARGAMLGAWVTGATWGAWSAVIAFEPDRSLVVMVVGVQAACVLGGCVRNSALRPAADGQTLLTLAPQALACVCSGDTYLILYAAFVGLHAIAAFGLTRFLHDQTLQLLRNGEEKSALAAGLETANQELALVNAHLQTLAATDALTGVANRRAFDLAIVREWLRGAREQTPLSLLLLDIDHFKSFNDCYGHPCGDRCLRDVAAACAAVVRRPADMLARYGGEEFAVVLPGVWPDDAARLADQIRAGIVARAVPHDASDHGVLTVSIGAACVVPQPDLGHETLVALADAALYAAKRGGRNRVASTDLPHAPLRERELL